MNIRAFKIDNIWMGVEVTERGTLLELSDYFSFQVPGFRFKQQHINGFWDGNIKLFRVEEQKMYAGLLPYLKKFAEQFGYTLIVDDGLYTKEVMSGEEVRQFAASLKLKKDGKPLKPRYFQLVALYYMINAKRATLVAPTASGKSLIIYMFARYLQQYNKRLSLIVPTTNLVEQMASDFSDYSNGAFDRHVHKIYSGKEKNDKDKCIYVTTWQSIYELPEMYFDQFEGIVIDEAHGAQAKSLKGILEKSRAEYRIGLTGTMHDPEAHKWVIEGLLGKTIDLISMQELMERKWVSNLKINCIVFDHGPETKREASGLDWHAEIKLLNGHETRTQKILKAVSKIEDNSFLLFDKVDYGDELYKRAKEAFPDRNVYLVYGATKVKDRETLRKALEKEKGSIVVASYKVFSTGTSINNLHHIFFAEPVGKSKFRILQSIGRSLRLHMDKAYATLWDFADKLTNSQNKLNHTMRHFVQERIPLYNRGGYSYTIVKVNVKDPT